MKIKTSKKQRLIIEYDLDMLKLSYCADAFAEKPQYKSVQVNNERIAIADFENLIKELACNVSSCDVLMFLSRSLFLNRYLTLPTSNADEVDKMLVYQLPKLIPYSMDEIIYDYKLISKNDNSSELLILILQKQKLDTLNSFLIKHNKVALYTGLSTELLMADFTDQLKDGGKCIFKTLDGRAEFVYFDKQIKFMRSFKFNDEKSKNLHLEQSLQLINKQFPQADAENFCESKALENEYLKIDDYEFEYDFSSLATQRLLKKRRLRKIIFNSVAVALELCLIFFIFAYKSDVLTNRKITVLKSEVKAMKDSLGDSSVVLDKLAVLETLQEERGIFSVLLHDLVSLLPKRTVISALNIDDNNSFVIKGYAPNMETIFKYVVALNNKDNFCQVNAKNVSKIKQKNSSKVEFSIDGKWLKDIGGSDA